MKTRDEFLEVIVEDLRGMKNKIISRNILWS